MLDKQRTSANLIYLLIARSVRRWRQLQQTQKHIYSFFDRHAHHTLPKIKVA